MRMYVYACMCVCVYVCMCVCVHGNTRRLCMHMSIHIVCWSAGTLVRYLRGSEGWLMAASVCRDHWSTCSRWYSRSSSPKPRPSLRNDSNPARSPSRASAVVRVSFTWGERSARGQVRVTTQQTYTPPTAWLLVCSLSS